MENNLNLKINNNETSSNFEYEQVSNPIESTVNTSISEITAYSQIMDKPKYDTDIAQIIEVVRILNNVAPISMPEYNFNIDEINGEHYYKPDGTLLLVRNIDNDVIRDYYYNPHYTDRKYSVSRIMEHDRTTGKLKLKIERTTNSSRCLKTSVAIFDEKISNKYVIINLTEDGIVSNFSEFSGNDKSFKTLFRNTHNYKPVRFIEGKNNKTSGFEMVDCLFTENGNVARIRRYTSKQEINIDYTETQKKVTVKNIKKPFKDRFKG